MNVRLKLFRVGQFLPVRSDLDFVSLGTALYDSLVGDERPLLREGFDFADRSSPAALFNPSFTSAGSDSSATSSYTSTTFPCPSIEMSFP